jgi:nucleoside-diphosphate-sugar epimerase
MAVLLAAAVLVDSKPPPQPRRADARPLRSPDSFVRDLRRCGLSRPCTSRGICWRRATTSARSTSCRWTTRSSETLTEIRGDMRDSERAKELCDGADVLVHGAAALPIRGSRQEIMSVNVDGTATLLAAAVGAVVRRVVYISSTAVYGVPKVHPLFENFPLVGVGPYGESKIACEGLVRSSPLETVIIRPKTFLGPERLGVFEIPVRLDP